MGKTRLAHAFLYLNFAVQSHVSGPTLALEAVGGIETGATVFAAIGFATVNVMLAPRASVPRVADALELAGQLLLLYVGKLGHQAA